MTHVYYFIGDCITYIQGKMQLARCLYYWCSWTTGHVCKVKLCNREKVIEFRFTRIYSFTDNEIFENMHWWAWSICIHSSHMDIIASGITDTSIFWSKAGSKTYLGCLNAILENMIRGKKQVPGRTPITNSSNNIAASGCPENVTEQNMLLTA